MLCYRFCNRLCMWYTSPPAFISPRWKPGSTVQEIALAAAALSQDNAQAWTACQYRMGWKPEACLCLLNAIASKEFRIRLSLRRLTCRVV